MEASSSSTTTTASGHFLITQGGRKPMISSNHSHGYDLLHSVRKPALYKPWRKQRVASLPPNPTRVYKVKPIEFKDVVQKLTGAAEFQSSRLQKLVPAPLDLNLGGVVRVLPDETHGNKLHQLPVVQPASGGATLSPGWVTPPSNSWLNYDLYLCGGKTRRHKPPSDMVMD